MAHRVWNGILLTFICISNFDIWFFIFPFFKYLLHLLKCRTTFCFVLQQVPYFFKEEPGLKKVYKYVKYTNSEVIKITRYSDVQNGLHHNDAYVQLFGKMQISPE